MTMNKPINYFLLSALFFVAFLMVQFTHIYGNPGWFKVFVLILSTSFLVSGIVNSKKKNGDSQKPEA
jgi:hypothetical protein